jgi:hypothetical protein
MNTTNNIYIWLQPESEPVASVQRESKQESESAPMWWQLKLQLVKLWPVAKVKAAQQDMLPNGSCEWSGDQKHRFKHRLRCGKIPHFNQQYSSSNGQLQAGK